MSRMEINETLVIKAQGYLREMQLAAPMDVDLTHLITEISAEITSHELKKLAKHLVNRRGIWKY